MPSNTGCTWEGFNPRPRAGGDPRGRQSEVPGKGFNPRPRAGGDILLTPESSIISTFQSTPPRGGRRNPANTSALLLLFQSTPPRGGRPGRASRKRNAPIDVSIHAPARGATVSRSWRHPVLWRFNPRPRAGGDAICLTCLKQKAILTESANLSSFLDSHLFTFQRTENNRCKSVVLCPSRSPRTKCVCFRFAEYLRHQNAFLINAFFCPYMFDSVPPV